MAELPVRAGDVVKAGDLVLVVDSPELGEAQSDLLQKRMALEAAKTSHQLARSVHERGKALFEGSQGINLAEVQKREGDLKAAESAVLSAEGAVRAAENRLALMGMTRRAIEDLETTGAILPRYPAVTPLAGEVVKRDVTLGELVGPDRESLLVVADLSLLWVLAEVPEARLAAVEIGSRASVTIAGRPGEVIESAVSYISPQIDPDTRTAHVRVEVKNERRALLPGMFASVEIFAAGVSAEPVLAVPDAAVQTIDGANSVFVPLEREEGAFAKRVITTGAAVDGMVAVLSGLDEGEKVVVDGSFLLKAEFGKQSAGHDHSH